MLARFLSPLFLALLLAACGPEEDASGTPPNRPPDSEPEPEPLTEAQRAHLDQMIGKFAAEEGYPNLAIGVVRGRSLVWHRGWGHGLNPDTPPDADTFFRAGSITKLVTATALLKLVEKGTLSLDDEASAWLPEAEAILSPPGRPAVTLRHLLSHASGLPPSGYPGADGAVPNLTEEGLFASLQGVQLLFDPGTSHSYSNMNYTLAGRIIERASGTSYRAYVQAEVFDPLGMKDSVWDPPHERLAPGHQPAWQGGYERIASTPIFGIQESAGGLFTTLRDLGRFASLGLGHGGVLDAATLALAQKPLGASGHGLGWLVVENPALGKLVYHNGSTGDYGAFLLLSPEHDLGVVVMAGTGLYGDRLELESLAVVTLAHLVAPDEGWLPLKATTPAATLEAVGDRLLALTNEPTIEAIEAAFAPATLAQIGADQVLSSLEEVVTQNGTCTSYEVAEDRGGIPQFSALFHLRCGNALFLFTVAAENQAPHRMLGLYLRLLEAGE